MKPIENSVLLSSLEDRVENHLRAAISVFQNLDESTLLRPSATGGWSIAQCLEHLNRYGDFYLPRIAKALNETSTKLTDPPLFKSTWLGSYFTKMLDPDTGSRKISAFKAYIPPPNLEAYAIVAQFITQQEMLLQLLHQAKSVDMNSIRIPVSIAKFIRLKVGDVFNFIIVHNERHVRQAMRNLPE